MKRTGSVFSRGKGKNRTWWARFIYVDEAGVRHDLQRKADSKAGARDIADDLADQYKQRGEKALTSERMTFAELADYCEKHYYKRAQYRGDRKVEGVRGLATATYQLNSLRAYFGKRRLRSLSYADLRAYRSHRLQTKSERTDNLISIATVNRELSMLRRILNVALAEGWIQRNPFNSGQPLISAADESKRERIISREEEARLLDACSAIQRQHLRPLLIAALDTGMRRGELLTLLGRRVHTRGSASTVRDTTFLVCITCSRKHRITKWVKLRNTKSPKVRITKRSAGLSEKSSLEG
jgi:integrase